jgi:hypothetical protein
VLARGTSLTLLARAKAGPGALAAMQNPMDWQLENRLLQRAVAISRKASA